MSKDKQYSDTLQRILQGAKFRFTKGTKAGNGITSFYLEEFDSPCKLIDLWERNTIRGNYRDRRTDFMVDIALTSDNTLVLESGIGGKRAELVYDVETDLELISE